jgi:putative flippase GtrA
MSVEAASHCPGQTATAAGGGPSASVTGALRSGAAFLMIGGGAAAIFIALSTWLLSLDTGIPRWLGSALCYALLVGPVYLAHHKVTFRSQARHRDALPKYLATQGLAVIVSALIAIPVYHLFHLDPLPGSILVTGLTSLGSFVILRLWTFRT